MNLVRVLLDILLTNNTRSKYPHELLELIFKERSQHPRSEARSASYSTLIFSQVFIFYFSVRFKNKPYEKQELNFSNQVISLIGRRILQR
jgi:hypothetical protein